MSDRSSPSKIAYFPKAYLHFLAKTLSQECGADFFEECENRKLSSADLLNDPMGISRVFLEDFDRCAFDLTEKRPDIWFRVGLQMRMTAYGVVGLAYLTSPNMKRTMDVCSEFLGLTNSLAIHEYGEYDDNSGGIFFDLKAVPRELHEHTLARDIATIFACNGDIWTTKFPYLKILLPSGYASLADILKTLDVPIELTDSKAAVLWTNKLEDTPLYNADEQLHALYVEECRKMCVARNVNPLVDRAMRVVEATLAIDPQSLSLPHVARVMGLSERSLQRRLGDSNHSFRSICDAARQRRANLLLSDGALSASDVALQLGYSEASSFLHAFRRWTGKTPREMRRDLRERAH